MHLCRTKMRPDVRQGQRHKSCSSVPALSPQCAETHIMQQGNLKCSEKAVRAKSAVQCTPVSASILRAAFCLASSLTSCHFFWNAGSSAWSRNPCTGKSGPERIIKSGKSCKRDKVTSVLCVWGLLLLWSCFARNTAAPAVVSAGA